MYASTISPLSTHMHSKKTVSSPDEGRNPEGAPRVRDNASTRFMFTEPANAGLMVGNVMLLDPTICTEHIPIHNHRTVPQKGNERKEGQMKERRGSEPSQTGVPNVSAFRAKSGGGSPCRRAYSVVYDTLSISAPRQGKNPPQM